MATAKEINQARYKLKRAQMLGEEPDKQSQELLDQLPPKPYQSQAVQTEAVQPKSDTLDLALEPAPVKEEKPKLAGREKEYYDFFRYRFGPLIVLILWMILGDSDKALFYAPNPEECTGLAPYAAKWLKNLKLPDYIHSGIINSDNAVGLLNVLVGYLDRIGALGKIVPYFAGIASRTRIFPNAKAKPVRPLAGTTEPNSTNGTGPEFNPLSIPGIGEQYRPM